MGSLCCFILALQDAGQTHPWKSSIVIGLLIGFVLISIAYGAWEWFQGQRAALVPRLMKDRNVLVNALYAFFFAGGYYCVVYYLPIYFQSIQNVNPTLSGVHNLPFILAVVIGIILTSGSISNDGILAHPFLVIGAVIATIGTALLYTLNIGSSTGKWIGFQILSGFGYGAFQVPIIAMQGTISHKDLASGTAIVLCQ